MPESKPDDALARSHYEYIHVNTTPEQPEGSLEEEGTILHHLNLIRPGKGLSRIYAAMKSDVQELEV